MTEVWAEQLDCDKWLAAALEEMLNCGWELLYIGASKERYIPVNNSVPTVYIVMKREKK